MGAIGFATTRGLEPTLNTLGARLFDIGSGYSLSAVPLFLLMGHMAIASRVTEDMFGAARAWVGHLRGSLVLATTFAATGFAACSGSTTSTTAVFGRVALPEMPQEQHRSSARRGMHRDRGHACRHDPPQRRSDCLRHHCAGIHPTALYRRHYPRTSHGLVFLRDDLRTGAPQARAGAAVAASLQVGKAPLSQERLGCFTAGRCGDRRYLCGHLYAD